MQALSLGVRPLLSLLLVSLCLILASYSPQASWFLMKFILGLKGIFWYYQDTWDEDPEHIAVK